MDRDLASMGVGFLAVVALFFVVGLGISDTYKVLLGAGSVVSGAIAVLKK